MDTTGWIGLIIAVFVTLLLPLGSALLLKRRVHIPLRIFFWGALFYLVNLLVQFPLLGFVGGRGIHDGTFVYAIVSSIIFGICEEVMRYLSFRSGKSMRTHRDHNGALMAGLGHGGTEALVLGFLTTIYYIYALVAPAAFDQGAKAVGTTTSQFLTGAGLTLMALALGRFLAVIGHLGFSTLSVMAYRVSWIFFPLVIVAHILLDATTFGILALTGSELWMFVVFIAWTVIMLTFIVYIRRSGIIKPEEQVSPLSSLTNIVIATTVVEP